MHLTKRLKRYFTVAFLSVLTFIIFGNLSFDNHNYQSFITTQTPLEIKKFAAYNPDYAHFLSIFKDKDFKTPKGWTQIDLNDNKKPKIYECLESGFEATAFKNEKEIVIVIRGVNLRKFVNFNIFKGVDGKSTRAIFFGNLNIPFLNKVPEQFEDAIFYYDRISQKYPHLKKILVGKSLGGALASLVGAIKGVETYTFGAPGVKYALPKLNKKYQKDLIKNSYSGFCNIKNYSNINDPCGNFGDPIGVCFTLPPATIKGNTPFYDVHGNTKHFAKKSTLDNFILKPKDWKFKYTLALIYYDKHFESNLNSFNLYELIKVIYRVKRQDLFKAISVIEDNFTVKKSPLKCTEKKKIVVSEYKCNAH